MAAMTPAQQLAEVKRKAALGIGLTGSSAANQAVYDQTRSGIDKEIARKADAGIALTSNSSDYNNKMYEGLLAAKNAQKPVVGTAQTNGAQSYIDGLAEARRNQTLAALDKSKNAALSNLGAEKSAIQPKYYDQRNQAAAGSQQSARNFAEFMAARGGTSSGANAQAELSRGMTLQGNLGALGRQEAADYSDIERRTSDLQNSYQSDVAAATAGMEGDRMQAMLTDYYNQQQRELQVAQLMGTYNGNSTLAKQAQQWGQTVDTANLTGNFNGQKTAQQAQQEWSNRFNYGNAIGQFSNGQQTLDNKQFQEGIRQDNRNFEYTAGRDTVQDAQWMQQFNEEVKQNGIGNALNWAQHNLSRSNSATDNALSRERFEYEKAQDKLKALGTNGTNQKLSAISPQRASFQDELKGLNAQLTSNQLSPDQALATLAQDYKDGYYTAAEEAFLKNAINSFKMKQASTNVFQR